jgi:aminopeptidase N
MYDRHLYPGGAARLHMLRHELGDESFWAGVRDYVKRFGGKTVETDDFRKVMEQHSGKSLVKWFEQWIESKGYPALKVSFTYDSKKKEGTFEVEQTQKTDDGIPVFEFSTNLGWTADGKAHSKPIRIEKQKHAFVIPMDAEPEQVRFDPGAHAVCKLDFNPGDEKLKKQLAATDVVGRIHAAAELCKSGKRANIEAVRDAYKTEKFWGVRVRMAGALGDAASQAAVEALADLLGVETDGMVCASLVRAAGNYRDTLISEALKRFLESGPKLYHARMAAYEALGAQRDDAPFELLSKAAQTDTPLGWEQAGAFRALAATRNADALPMLIEATRRGRTSNRARHAAAGALGGLAKQSEKLAREKSIERLTDLLRDPTPRVQKFAVMGLKAAVATEALDAVESWGTRVSEQEQTDAKRAAAAIRAAAKPKAPAQDKQLEELRDKLRKAEDRLGKLEARAELK